MNILIIGNGGREHAFAWKIRQSTHCDQLFVAPGNAGTACIATNVPIAVDDFPALGRFCLEHLIGLVVVGPEVPLVKGIRDYFQEQPELKKIPLVGPDRTGARLEGSKDFSKQFMLRHHIPTARAKTFQANEADAAYAYLRTIQPPIVLKADGLAAGKGVVIAPDVNQAIEEMREMLVDRKFGDASARVLVEEFLSGIELSVFVLTDGTDYVILPEAKDYKRIGEGDTGPNTGGMGAVSPVPFADAEFLHKVEERIVKPTIRGLKQEGIDYRGFIFIGLMNCAGEPYVIEYNARMGDPETQAVFSRLQSDLVELLLAAANGRLGSTQVSIDPRHAVTVVMVSGGYPGDYPKGKIISGLDASHESTVFHAGTKRGTDGNTITDGGRVLALTGMGTSLAEARDKAYADVTKVSWDGVYFRSDIGLDLLAYEKQG
jgi:phosphoribosylamine--glycine ligase